MSMALVKKLLKYTKQMVTFRLSQSDNFQCSFSLWSIRVESSRIQKFGKQYDGFTSLVILQKHARVYNRAHEIEIYYFACAIIKMPFNWISKPSIWFPKLFLLQGMSIELAALKGRIHCEIFLSEDFMKY